MKEYKTQEAILKHAPTLDETDIQKLNGCFENFIFYEDDKKAGVQRCICSHCRQSFQVPILSRTIEPWQTEFLQSGHNAIVHCPLCKAQAQKKQKGKARSCATLSNEFQRAVFVKPVSENEVYLLFVYSTKTYKKIPANSFPIREYADYSTAPSWKIEGWYYITPNQQRYFAYSYYNEYFHSGPAVVERKIREPFTKSYCYNFATMYHDTKIGYIVFGLENLKSTFLKYFDFDSIETIYENYFSSGYYNLKETPFCKIICRFAKYPSMEWLTKQRYDSFVVSLIENGENATSYFDWQAKGPYEFFKKLKKEEIKRLNKYGLLQRDLIHKYLQLKAKCKKLTAEQFKYLLSSIPANRYKEWLETIKKYNISLPEFIKWEDRWYRSNVDKLRISRDWLDYISAAEFCKYDLTVHNVLLPKDIRKAHNEAINNKNAIQAAQERAKNKNKLKAELEALKHADYPYSSRYKKLCKLYEFDNGLYTVIVPHGATEIILEGNALKHCVEDYAARHISGSTTILFIRKSKDPSVSLLTVEIDDKTLSIQQVHGLNNRNPKNIEKSFIEM